MKLRVTGMSCDHCARAVKAALEDVPGVERVVAVSAARGEAEIEGQADVATLVKAVADEGYEAEPV